jgi:hypothetical protein
LHICGIFIKQFDMVSVVIERDLEKCVEI